MKCPRGRDHATVFVNYGGFALDCVEMNDLASLFWEQLEWIRPESYIADGDFLNFVTSNKALFAIVRDNLKSHTERTTKAREMNPAFRRIAPASFSCWAA